MKQKNNPGSAALCHCGHIVEVHYFQHLVLVFDFLCVSGMTGVYDTVVCSSGTVKLKKICINFYIELKSLYCKTTFSLPTFEG
jgi:hypothetical protein